MKPKGAYDGSDIDPEDAITFLRSSEVAQSVRGSVKFSEDR